MDLFTFNIVSGMIDLKATSSGQNLTTDIGSYKELEGSKYYFVKKGTTINHYNR